MQVRCTSAWPTTCRLREHLILYETALWLMLQVGSMSIRQHCDGTQPSRLAWLLKERMLPPLYWDGMLKGREWLAQPDMARSPAQ